MPNNENDEQVETEIVETETEPTNDEVVETEKVETDNPETETVETETNSQDEVINLLSTTNDLLSKILVAVSSNRVIPSVDGNPLDVSEHETTPDEEISTESTLEDEIAKYL